MSINWDNVHSPFIDPMGFYTRHISVRKKKGGQGQPPPGPSGSGGPVSCSLTASSNQVAPGTVVTLTWNTTNAILADINGSNVALPSGSEQVTVSQNTTYTLTAHGVLGDTATASQTITVTSATRDPATWPFAKLSPWNYPLGQSATYAAINFATGPFSAGVFVDATVSGTPGQGGYIQTPPGVYIAKSDLSDPVRTFNVNNFFGTNGPINTAYFGSSSTGATPNFSRHCPNNMTSNTTDGILCIISPDHLVAMSGEGWNGFAQLPATGSLGTLTSGLTINEDLKGPGWNGNATAANSPTPLPCIAINAGDEATPYPSSNPTSGSPFQSPGDHTNASGTSMLGGMIRVGELKNGIPHALQCITSAASKNKNAPGGNTWVWPATTSDGGGAGSGYGTTGNVYLGCLFAIPRTVNVSGLTWNHIEALNIALALQQFGGYNVDSGGSGSFVEFRTEVTVALNGEVPSDAGWTTDMTQIQNNLQIVTNSFNPNTGGIPRTGIRIDGGDGTLLAGVAPPFAAAFGGGDGRAS